MKTFIVKTWESVEGTYAVQAESEEDARNAFKQPGPEIDWDRVEQREYVAFSVEVCSARGEGA